MIEIRPNRSLICGMHDGNLAHVLVLSCNSVIPKEEAQELIRALLDFRAAERGSELPETIGAWEAALEQQLGPSAAWLKADRSELEMVGVAFMLEIRRRILELGHLHLGFAETMVALADQHRETVISHPGNQSNGAVSTLGHCLLTYVYPAFRDLERLQHCYRSFNSSPCGAGKNATGTRLSIDRDRMRTLLGFDETRPHAADALWQADGPIELMAAIVALLVNLNRMGDDLRSWATAADSVNIAWVRSVTSSLLAKVPELASLGKEFGENPERFVAVSAELNEAFEGANRTIDRLTSFVQRSVEFAAMSQKPRVRSVQQSDLVDVIATRGGVDRATAQKMALEVQRLIARGEIDFESLTPQAMDVIAIQLVGRPLNLTEADLASAIEPSKMVAARTGSGGVASERLTEMITECRARLIRESLWVSTVSQRLAKSEGLLTAEARDAAGI
jgi:argininosuccinate lyase